MRWLALAGLAALPALSGAAEVPNADRALEELQKGNARFAKGKMLQLRRDQARRDETAEGQHPLVTVLTCSDSRLPPEIVFDQGLGDVFTVRVAGNVADVDEIGTVEYGVGHLHTPLCVVLGHTACGAVTAVVKGAEVHGSIPALVDNIVPAVESARLEHPELSEDQLIPAAIEANVFQAIEDLFTHSEEVRQLVGEGKLRVLGAVYDIQSGKVRWLGVHPGQAALLSGGGKARGKAEPAHTTEHAEPAEPGHGGH
ncbi:MAG: carbonic anhydrase [Candidatus Latescibacteria bacterium]|nr:carbonic anhydrase [Candidatus Latescibacterota bacterium]